MRLIKAFVGIVPATLLLCACDPPQEVASGSSPQPQAAAKSIGKYILGEPIEDGNLTVIPVTLVASTQQTQPLGRAILQNTITLAQAKERGTVEIFEKPGDNTVDTLRVRNLGKEPILMLTGELLLGGKQDRIVAADVIVPALGELDVAVYCVEHGRWSGTNPEFEYSTSVVPHDVRRAAQTGTQEDVWAEIAEYNADAAPTFKGTTVRGGFNSPMVQARIESGFAKILNELQIRERVVGAIFAIGGEIKSFELFGSERLFDAGIEGILRGYLAQAAVVEGDGNVNFSGCEALLRSVVEADRSDVGVNGAGTLQKLSAEVGVAGAEIRFRNGEIAHGSYSAK